jgi:catalase
MTWRGVPVTRRRILLGLGAVGAFAALDAGAVVWAVGDWPSRRLTAGDFVDAFRAAGGDHPGYRLNHAKGVAVSGYFDSNGAAREITTARVLAAGRTPVVGRFSLPGANPHIVDSTTATRGLGLAFGYPHEDQWRTAMLSLPVFTDNSPEGFRERVLASAPQPATGKPDPAAMQQFLTAHPETAAAMRLIDAAPKSTRFADDTFRSLIAFYFVDAAGRRTPVRWAFEPVERVATTTSTGAGPNRLFDALVSRIRTRPLAYRLLLTVGEPSDTVVDATLPWPPGRRVIDAGTLTLTSVMAEAPGNARDVNFDPTVLPSGIEVSPDPLLSARSAVYAASFRRRAAHPDVAASVEVPQVSA